MSANTPSHPLRVCGCVRIAVASDLCNGVNVGVLYTVQYMYMGGLGGCDSVVCMSVGRLNYFLIILITLLLSPFPCYSTYSYRAGPHFTRQ